MKSITKKAFTLVELLVVISIIAMLLSILLPSLSRVRESARKISCASHIKTTTLAATLAANDDTRGYLPQGGYHDEKYNIDFDSPLLMGASSFAKLAHYIAGTSYQDEYKYGDADALASLKKIYAVVNKSKVADNFCCINLRKQKQTYPGDISGYENIGFPLITEYGNVGYCAWTGYNYLAGFDTDKWMPMMHPRAVKWRSAMTMQDPGTSVVMTDRNRYLPSQKYVMLMHRASGLSYYASRTDDPKAGEAGSAFTNVGYLDGSVQTLKISNTNYRQVTMYNGRYWGEIGGQDYCFF